MDTSMRSLVVEHDLKETFYRNAAGGISSELSASGTAKIFWRKRNYPEKWNEANNGELGLLNNLGYFCSVRMICNRIIIIILAKESR